MSVRAGDQEATSHIPQTSPWKGDNEKSSRLILGSTQFLRGAIRLRAARQVKATLIFDTFVPFPPLTSLILTHHLNKEVRAMIKSLHSVDCVARQTLDPTDPCVNPPHPSFCYFIIAALSWRSLSVVELNRLVGVRVCVCVCGITLPHLPLCKQFRLSGY